MERVNLYISLSLLRTKQGLELLANNMRLLGLRSNKEMHTKRWLGNLMLAGHYNSPMPCRRKRQWSYRSTYS